MESSLSALSQHGYAILFVVLFLETIGLPIPAAPALLIAGAASAHGSLFGPYAWASALSGALLGDTLLFLMGRYTGWWFLGVLCRLSLNPESCILRSADTFYRRGRTLLVFARFVPGLNSMVPSLAGSMNMRVSQFLGLDFSGAALYTGAYLTVGFLFSGALDAVTTGYHTFGRLVGWALLAAALVYVGLQIRMWIKARALRSVPFVRPSDVARTVSSDDALIYDVRSHGYYDRNATRIRGSRRLEPNALNRFEADIPAGKPVYLYCTCVRAATSARVAQMLLDKGVKCAVIEGGLRAWKKAGLPVEPVPSGELVELPSFGS